MKRDLRADPLYRETRAFFDRVYAGSFGKLASVQDVRASPDGRWIALAGSSYDALSGLPRTRIGVFDCVRQTLAMLAGERNDSNPRWSPDSRMLAFLSDRTSPGFFSPHIYDVASARVRTVAPVGEPVEALAWSPDGTRLLLQCAPAGAERAGAQGSGVVGGGDGKIPEWIPQIEGSSPEPFIRRIWIYAADGSAAQVVDWLEATVWEAEWCGNDGIVAVVSDDPREAGWFRARLVFLDLRQNTCETIYSPAYQIGLPAATPDGRYVAIVEGCCSDRGIVAGDVLLFDRMLAWHESRVDTGGVDVTYLCASESTRFAFAGVRDFDVAAGQIQTETAAAEVQASNEGWALRLYPGIAALPDRAYATVEHSYSAPPALVRYDESGKRTDLHRFSYEGSAFAVDNAGDLARRIWTAPDGLEIHGYLAHSRRASLSPLVVLIHGGPVYAYGNTWCLNAPIVPFLVSRGYAVLLPNPRGSSGRGQTFARLICGDIGGAEAGDVLSGVQALVNEGVVDPAAVAVMGGSHGGYLAAWLVTQTDRFAAAICAFPVTDLFSGYFTGTPSEAVPPFIKDDAFDVCGQYFTRSPIMHAKDVHTPVLIFAGANDHCTGTSQGLELHRALLHAGATSELVTYPLEGHGVRNMDAYIDYSTRVLHWLQVHVSGARSRTS